MTHIAVQTESNQLVTVDMPMTEAKRITVKQNVMVVEDKDFVYGPSGKPTVSQAATSKTNPAAKAEDKIIKPIVVPTGVPKPVETSCSAVSSCPPKPIVVPIGSGSKPAPCVKPVPPPVQEPESESDSSSDSSSDEEEEECACNPNDNKQIVMSRNKDELIIEHIVEKDSEDEDQQKAPIVAKKPGKVVIVDEAEDSSESDSDDDDDDDEDSSSDSSSSSDDDDSDDDEGAPEAELRAIIGNAKTRPQALINAGNKFDELDTTKDGLMSVDEVTKLLTGKPKVTAQERRDAENFLDILDLNRDGSVTRNEWIEAFGKMFDQLMEMQKGGAAVEGKKADDSGDEGDDEDEDKKAPVKEKPQDRTFAKIFENSAHKSAVELKAAMAFDVIDRTLSGKVSVDELLRIVSEDQGKTMDLDIE